MFQVKKIPVQFVIDLLINGITDQVVVDIVFSINKLLKSRCFKVLIEF